MSQEWGKKLVATAILSMAMGSAAVIASANGAVESDRQALIGFSDQSYISSANRASVQEAVEKGLLTGYADASFRPNQLLTRQEFAVLLAKAMHLEPKQQSVSSFSDIKDRWALPYIEALVKAGLIQGDGVSTFRPAEPITREELATLIVRAIDGVDAQGGEAASAVDREKVSPWADQAVSMALRLGIMHVDSNGFNPQGNVKRQDIAAYLIEIFKAQERTATIDRIDRDMVVIDGKSYLISGALKDLLGARNREALAGAVLKYKSVNHNVEELLRIELTASGKDGTPRVLDVRNTSFTGELAIAADHIAVRGDSLSQVLLKQGAGSLDLRAKVAQVVVDTSKTVTIEGSGQWGKLVISNLNASLHLSKDVAIDKLELPKGASADKLIANYNDIKHQISSVPASEGAKQPTVSPGSGSGSGSTSSSNHNPTVVNKVSDRIGYIGSGHVTVELKQVFIDPDGDPLRFSAQSSDLTVAEASVSGTTLSLVPRQKGKAVITISAADGKGGVSQTSFTFEVHKAVVENRAPIPTRVLGDQTIVKGTAPHTVSTVDLFTDEDGDSLALSVLSSKASVAEAVYENGLITLAPISEGQASITVTANDGKGGIGVTVFAVEVEAPAPVNHAPVVSNTISDLTTSVAGGNKTVSLENVFTDEDQDILTYSAVSSNAGVATVAIHGADLSITPIASGTVTITVTANDGRGGIKSTTFKVTVEALAPKGLFISETVYASEAKGFGMQAIELYNPLDEDIDGSKITITRSDGGDAIVVNSGILKAKSTFVIMEAIYGGGIYYEAPMGFYNDDSAPVLLSLYLHGKLVDQAYIVPYKTMVRKLTTTTGNSSTYDPEEWVDKGTDFIDDLGKFGD